MAKKPKKGDKITDASGVTWTYSSGKHWKDPAGKLFGNGKGEPVAGPAAGTASTPGSPAYLEALDKIQGGSHAEEKRNLDSQVKAGWITQAQADAQYAKSTEGLNTTGLGQGLKDLAGGDSVIEKGLQGGAEVGASLFAPGALGRVSEEASPEQTRLNSWFDHLSSASVDPLLQPGIDRANKTADDAQTLDPELQNVLNLRKSALGGLSTTELLAEKESAQSGLNQSLTSAVRALRVGRGGSGPQGAASNIATTPLTAQFANSQGELQRKLILDQYTAKKEALNSYSSDAKDITGGFQSNKIAANTAAGTAASTALTDRAARYNQYVNYNSALRNDLLGRQLTNLNAVAAEKSGQAATIFGGGAFAAQQKGQTQSFELGKQNLDLQKDIFDTNKESSSGGGGGGGGGSSSPGGGNEDAFG